MFTMAATTTLVAFFCLLFTSDCSAELTPVFSCWFTSYDDSHHSVTNYVLGYNNTGSSDVITGSLAGNTLLPLVANGEQPSVFKVGFYPFVLSVKNFVSWSLADSFLQANQLALTPATRCDTAFANACPVLIDGFCEDGVYCNGRETCFSTRIFGMQTPAVIGTCQPSHQPIVCPVDQPVCEESSLSCVVAPTASPTAAPTEAAIVTEPPTEAATTVQAPLELVLPTFFCWYTAPEDATRQPPQMIKFLVFSYDNVATQTLLLVPGEVGNSILPVAYTPQLPTRFLAGSHAHSVVIADSQRVLDRRGGSLTWTLNGTVLVVDALSRLTNARRCVQPITEAPATPDNREVTIQCTETAPDCTAFASYCLGPAVCNTVTQQCIPADPTYSPCATADSALPLAVTCIEHLGFCAASINCSFDSQCVDGLFCNGQEYCGDNGTCLSQVNFACPTDQTCVEGQGCVSSGYSISNGAIAAIVIIGGIALIGVCVLIVIYTRYGEKTSRKSKNKNKNK